MDCKTFEASIPAFLAGELDLHTQGAFIYHYEHCSECREEFDIQFLVTKGLQRLEGGDAFDLQSEMEEMSEQIKRRIRRKDKFDRINTIAQVSFVIVIFELIIWLVI